MGDESRFALPLEVEDESPQDEPYDFERAIEACGFGTFNMLLIFASLPGIFSSIFESTTMSFVIPAAECDLNLSHVGKGALNAVTFGGMLISAFPWGFMADTFGRKFVLIVALLLEGILTALSVLSRNLTHLLIFKFFGGVVSCVPLAVFISYISEFHGKKHRLYVVIGLGLIMALPLIILPTMATFVLPREINYSIGSLKINSWKTFILITAIPGLVSGVLLFFFPESPKFLMSQGKNDLAIKVFRKIYAINKLKKKDTYPITSLVDEAPEKSRRRSSKLEGHHHRLSLKEQRKDLRMQLTEGLKQLQLLITKSYVKKTILTCSMNIPLVMSVNSVRLWQPQFFAALKEMQHQGLHELSTCSIINFGLNKTRLVGPRKTESDAECEVFIQPSSYVNSIGIAGAACLNYVLTTFLIRIIGNNTLLKIYMCISSVSLISLYWSKSHVLCSVLLAAYSACGIVCITLVLNATVNIYPTTIRAMAVIILMSCGRLGSVIGSLILPLLLAFHCIAMFAFFSVAIICSLVLSFVLPNTTEEGLK